MSGYSNDNRYAWELCHLKVAPLLLPLFPNFKEVTESFSAFHAVRNHLDIDTKDPDVTVICVGDGSTPRTGATFALRTAWTVFSIDPLLRRENLWKRNIKRLTCDPRPIEKTKTICKKQAILVAVHSHANLSASIQSLTYDKLAVVAMPCCVDLSLSQTHDLKYEDEGCISPERTVKIWKDIHYGTISRRQSSSI